MFPFLEKKCPKYLQFQVSLSVCVEWNPSIHQGMPVLILNSITFSGQIMPKLTNSVVILESPCSDWKAQSYVREIPLSDKYWILCPSVTYYMYWESCREKDHKRWCISLTMFPISPCTEGLESSTAKHIAISNKWGIAIDRHGIEMWKGCMGAQMDGRVSVCIKWH